MVPIVAIALAFPYVIFLKEHTGQWQVSGKVYANLVLGELKSPYRTKGGESTSNVRYRIIAATHRDPTRSGGIATYLKDGDREDITDRILPNLTTLFRTYWFAVSPVGLGLLVAGFVTLRHSLRPLFLVLLLFILGYALFFVSYRVLASFHWILAIFIAGGIRCIRKPAVVGHALWKGAHLGLVTFLVLFEVRGALRLPTW
jgi:hypothetical protein